MDMKRDASFLRNKEQKQFKHEKIQNTKTGDELKKQFKTGKEKQKELKQLEHFNKNHNGLDDAQEADVKTKKPFDKKTYRLKKYSKKYKLEQWEEQRKKKLIRNYYKDVKNDETTGSYKAVAFDEDTTDSNQAGRFVRHPDLVEQESVDRKQELQQKRKKDPFMKAKEHYNKMKQEKLAKKQDVEKAREERNHKLQEYKKKKQERFKKLSKKTKKGQPVMTGRLELLLEKIQNRSK